MTNYSHKYELHNMGDILNIPVERFDAFTKELKEWRTLHETNTQAIALEPLSTIESMNWIDDGLDGMHEHYYTRDGEEKLDLGTIDLRK